MCVCVKFSMCACLFHGVYMSMSFKECMCISRCIAMYVRLFQDVFGHFQKVYFHMKRCPHIYIHNHDRMIKAFIKV